ncbi:nuclear ribonuclease P subunit Rpp30 (Rpp1) [Andalucia godoyi]|uniref:Nuclear ribonuclease P subunit Rpp30 (Rpp1) n=1 Tax=Andalucia godoyi TaxID=505711 RepID=A0A8K0AIH4_ANDGO|nr:nuclear ribonuclease P subunit Rpp30 (Rpp1) [Andalucia godoyi]|eukprot:ANDGO_08244.mRNA.1 nuclear ribonuclease P subunit Rpp30 (Rpp1)
MLIDWSVPVGDANLKRLSKICDQCKSLGFGAAALDLTIQKKPSARDVHSLLQAADSVRAELKLSIPSSQATSSLTINGFRVLTRVTYDCASISDFHQFVACLPMLKDVDVLAFRSVDEKALLHVLTSSSDFQIISFDLSQRMSSVLRFPIIKQALSRSLVFEIAYGVFVREPSVRTPYLSNLSVLYRVTKGRGILFSSSASFVTDLRQPQELCYLSTLFGQKSPSQCLASWKRASCDVSSRALLRKFVKGSVEASIEDTVMSANRKRGISETSVEESSGKRKKTS